MVEHLVLKFVGDTEAELAVVHNTNLPHKRAYLWSKSQLRRGGSTKIPRDTPPSEAWLSKYIIQ
jgi:hypothetical protein